MRLKINVLKSFKAIRQRIEEIRRRKHVVEKFQLPSRLCEPHYLQSTCYEKSNVSDCFILGSGRSLLRLTNSEIGFVNKSPFTLSFNKYLIFYRKIGIVPTHHMIGDNHPKAMMALEETLNVCVRDNLNITFFLTHELLNQFIDDRKFVKFFIEHNFNARTVLFKRSHWLWGARWAKSLKNEIFHYRGSLTGAVNITSILNPGKTIKLLGVDLNDPYYFFQEEIESDLERWGLFLSRLTPYAAKHETVETFANKPGVQSVFPYLTKKVRDNKGSLCCGFSDSYLVKNSIVKFEPIIEV